MIPRAFVLACVVLFASANPIARNLVPHESRPSVPVEFIESGPASDSTVLKLRAALTPTNIAGLESELYAVSDPASARYGQHLSKEQVSFVITRLKLSLIFKNRSKNT